MDANATSSTLRHRVRMIALVAALSGLALSGGPTVAVAQDEDLDALGAQLVTRFVDILKQADDEKRDALTGFLADEFQIVRSNGARLDQAGYIDDPATVFEVEISDVHATEANGVLVVSYVLSVDEVLDGVETRTTAPRLSVFHRADSGEWQISAHANFGALDPS